MDKTIHLPNALLGNFLGLSFIAIVLVASFLFSLRRRQLLREWAEDNGLVILQSNRRVFFCGPFTWSASKSKTVYFVRFRDVEGRERAAWIRMGFPIDMSAIEVRWKEDSAT